MPRAIRLSMFVAILTAWAVAVPLHAQVPAGAPPKGKPQPAARPAVAVTISRETTYVTGPLRKDGYVDYVAALDERFRQGVTPDNNSVVVFSKAIGPGRLDSAHREQYFKMLGISRPPEEGHYYVTLDEYLKQSAKPARPVDARAKSNPEQARVLLGRAMIGPWSAQQLPQVAGWLAANEKPLSLVIEATKRPRLYDPLINRDGGPLVDITPPALGQHREMADALIARAMQKLGDGKIDEAGEDLLAVHRLARLANQGPLLFDWVRASAIDFVACAGDELLLQHSRLTSVQAMRFGDALAKLPPWSRNADRIDAGERFLFLDGVSIIAREGPGSIYKAIGGPQGGNGSVASPLNADWDLVLRMGNGWYDRIAAAHRLPTRSERKAARKQINEEIVGLYKAATDHQSQGLSGQADPRKGISQQVATSLASYLVPLAMNGDAYDRSVMQSDLTRLAYALAAYRADCGKYPAKLADVAPKYVAAVPSDVFAAGPLRYGVLGDGYLLYSLGINGQDDGGKSYQDRKSSEDWDDLRVRIPAVR